MLETAAEQMMVHKDFQAVFDTCSRGLEGLKNLEQEDSRWKPGAHTSTHCTLFHLNPPYSLTINNCVVLCFVSSGVETLKLVSAS